MATVEQRIKFIFEGDVKAKNAFKAISREQQRLVQEFRDGNRTYEQSEQALRELGTSAEKTERALESLRKEQQRLNQTEINTQRFDRTSRNVALAGDVQSNLGAIGGLASAAGAGGAGQAIGITGEIVVLGEELPRLKEALRGLPDVARNAASALGTNVVSLGAFGLALGALVAVYKIANAQAEKQADALRARFDAEDRRFALEAEFAGLTETQVQARLAEAEAAKELAARSAEASQARIEATKTMNPFIKAIAELSAFLRVGDQSLRVTREDAKKDANNLAAAELELNTVRKAASNQTERASDTTSDFAKSFEGISSELSKQTSASAKAESAISKLKNETDSFASSAQSAAGSIASASDGIRRDVQGGVIRGGSGGDPSRLKSSGGLTLPSGFNPLSFGGKTIATAGKSLAASTNTIATQTNTLADQMKRENEIRRQFNFDQEQARREFAFSQNELLGNGDFGGAFNAARQFKFNQSQSRRQFDFQASERQQQQEVKVTVSMTPGLTAQVQQGANPINRVYRR